MVGYRLALITVLASGGDAVRARTRATDCFSKYDGMTLLKLNACDSVEEATSRLSDAGCYILDEPAVQQLGCVDAEVVCSGDVAALLKAGLGRVVSRNAGALWRSESGVTQTVSEGFGIQSDFYSDWRDLAAQEAHVKSLVASSSVATLEVAGKTVQGRDMNIVRIRGRGYIAEKNKTRVFLTFNLHAREWLTGMTGVYAVEHLIKKAEEDISFFDETEVVLMPMANPDGFYQTTTVDRMHRKNMADNDGNRCKGVDLNRNFDAHWAQGGSSSNKCQDTYHGPGPNSEPETLVVAKVMEEAKMSVYIDVHSYTQLVITSPAWTRSRSARHSTYRAVGGAIQQAIQATNGKSFTEGATAEVLYVASGGSIDFADDRGALGICLELRPTRFGGGGFAPNKREIRPGAEETYNGILAAIRYAQDPSAAPAPAPTNPPGGNCPWTCNIFGCNKESCQYCDCYPR